MDFSRKRGRIGGTFQAGLISLGLAGAVGLGGLWCWYARSGHASQSSNLLMAGQVEPGGHVAGTAFAVAPGLMVTNAHVTLRCRAADLPVQVADQDGWRVVAEDPTLELALLAAPAAAADQTPPLPLSAVQRVRRGTKVLLLGYPLTASATLGPLRVTPGVIERPALTVHQPGAGTSVSFSATAPDGSAVDPSWADGVAYFGAQNADRLRWILQIAAPAGHGDSGGPVVDGDGALLGVIFAGSADAPETSAVTLSDLRQFLLKAGITPQFAPPADPDQPASAATAERVAQSVVRVGC